jgi:glycosyltransferase involved in cell wall biosynthesis
MVPSTDAAGAENQALALLAGLAERDVLDLELVCFAQGRNHARFLDLGIPIHELGRHGRLAFDLPRRVRTLRRLFTGGPAILHTWLFEANAVGLAAARRWPQTRVVVSQRSGTMEREMPWHLRATRALIGRADQAVANSPEGAELLRDLGVPSEKVTVVGQGVDPDRASERRSAGEVRAELGVAADTPLVVTVGRADHTKDFPVLLAAMERVWRARPDCRLALVGPTAEELRAEGVELPARTTAVGWYDHPADYLNAADVVAISSWTEGYSNVAAEALWLGRPVVTTNTGAHPPLVDECGGGVVPIREPELLGDAILACLASPPPPDRVRSVARQALGVEAVVDATLAVYERATHDVRARARS